MSDPAFLPDAEGLGEMLRLLCERPEAAAGESPLPEALPETGLGERDALSLLAPRIIGGARDLASPGTLFHMDPPTPWISWGASLWTAALNQNLLHPDTAPAAREIERQVVDWLAPVFGMQGGHMLPGSTLANLTALWAAREIRGVRRVLASGEAHLSIAKAAHLLALELVALPVDRDGRLEAAALPSDLADCALVLTAGTTARGAIDPLNLAGRAAWTHVDAAWAGPLRLSPRYGARLNGLEGTDSLAVSAHKWLFQPKESALVLFRDRARADAALSFGGGYLAVPNIGLMGSHGAMAVPLLATLLAWGREGLAARIEHCMAMAEDLAARLDRADDCELSAWPETGVLLWRPRGRTEEQVAGLQRALPPGTASLARLNGEPWLRQVAANPNASIDRIWSAIGAALDG